MWENEAHETKVTVRLTQQKCVAVLLAECGFMDAYCMNVHTEFPRR